MKRSLHSQLRHRSLCGAAVLSFNLGHPAADSELVGNTLLHLLLQWRRANLWFLVVSPAQQWARSKKQHPDVEPAAGAEQQKENEPSSRNGEKHQEHQATRASPKFVQASGRVCNRVFQGILFFRARQQSTMFLSCRGSSSLTGNGTECSAICSMSRRRAEALFSDLGTCNLFQLRAFACGGL